MGKNAESFEAEESRREWTFLWKPKNEGWGNSVYATNLKGAKEQVLKTYPKGSSFFQRADLSTLTDDSIVNKQRWRNWDSQWNADDESFKYGCSKCKQFFNTWCQCEEWYGIEAPQSNWYEVNAESFEAPKGKKDFEYFSNKKENANGIRLMIPFRKETEWYGDDKYIIKNEIIDKYTFKDTDIRYDRDYFRNKECNVVEFITFDETDKKIVDDVIDELKSKGFKVSKSKYFYHWLDVYGAESFGAEYEPPKMKDGDLIDFGDGHGYIKIGSHGRYNRDGSMISPVKSMHCGSNGIYVLIGNITGQSTFVLISQDKEKLKQKYREYSNFDEWHDFETKKDADSWWKSNRLEDILEKGYSSLHVVLLKEVIEAMHDPNRINVGTTEKDGKYADGTPRFKRFNAENWGGDPEGPLAKALEKARKKSKKSKKPLKIEKLDAESFSAEQVRCASCMLKCDREDATVMGGRFICDVCQEDDFYAESFGADELAVDDRFGWMGKHEGMKHNVGICDVCNNETWAMKNYPRDFDECDHNWELKGWGYNTIADGFDDWESSISCSRCNTKFNITPVGNVSFGKEWLTCGHCGNGFNECKCMICEGCDEPTNNCDCKKLTAESFGAEEYLDGEKCVDCKTETIYIVKNTPKDLSYLMCFTCGSEHFSDKLYFAESFKAESFNDLDYESEQWS